MNHEITEEMINLISQDPDAVKRVLERAKLMTMSDIASRLGMSYDRVKVLNMRRRAYEEAGEGDMPRSDALPPPLMGTLWDPAVIEVWGLQTGRIDVHGVAQRARPTGRPRKRRDRAA